MLRNAVRKCPRRQSPHPANYTLTLCFCKSFTRKRCKGSAVLCLFLAGKPMRQVLGGIYCSHSHFACLNCSSCFPSQATNACSIGQLIDTLWILVMTCQPFIQCHYSLDYLARHAAQSNDSLRPTCANLCSLVSLQRSSSARSFPSNCPAVTYWTASCLSKSCMAWCGIPLRVREPYPFSTSSRTAW